MSSFSKVTFIRSTINNSSIVKSTKIDSTLKAIINSTFKQESSLKKETLLEYLNTLRIVYYISRLRFYNISRYNSTISKFFFIFLYLNYY